MNTAGADLTKFEFVSVLLETERLDLPLQLKNVVTDLDIFEHIDLPYLTAMLSFSDSGNVYSHADLLGGEKITITLKSNREEASPITKTFYILEVMSVVRTSDQHQVVNLQLIEDIGYISNLYNVNKSYTGKGSTIIKKISQNNLNKQVLSSDNDQQSMKVIIPNLSPMDAMCWIKNRTTTTQGYPFYLFSTLADDFLYFYDLGTMLEQEVINQKVPYKAWQGASRSMIPIENKRLVLNYKINDFDNLYLLIKKGVIGSEYEFVDTLKNKRRQVKFDIDKDLIGPLLERGVIKKPIDSPLFSASYLHNEKSFNKYSSRSITNIGTSSPYEKTDNRINAYSEAINSADYKLTVLSKAMNEIMKKNPLVITVDGLDYIDGDKHSTIGNNIKIDFLRTMEEDGSGEYLDPKLSGDYLIYAARHMFKREEYNVAMTCVKMGNYRQ